MQSHQCLLFNDGVFADTFKEALSTGKGEQLIPNLVTTYDENGNKVVLVCMLDQKTGQLTIGFSMDENGNVLMNPKTPGAKTITAVNSKGRRVTKTVVVPADQPLDVEVDFEDEDLSVLREYPENGELVLKPSSFTFSEDGGSKFCTIITNYLYYTCQTNEKWLSARIPSDMNRVYITCSSNDKEEDRTGTITVSATDSKGKVLKTASIKVTQKAMVPTQYYVSASPSELEFDAEGGELETVIDQSYAYIYRGASSSGLSGYYTDINDLVIERKSKNAYGGYKNWTLKASQVGIYKNTWSGEFSDLIWKGTAENGNLVITSLEGERYDGELKTKSSFSYSPDPQDEIIISASFLHY